jgi:hypothetical protein
MRGSPKAGERDASLSSLAGVYDKAKLKAFERRRRVAVRRHARLAGELIWAWNELQEGFCFTFA